MFSIIAITLSLLFTFNTGSSASVDPHALNAYDCSRCHANLEGNPFMLSAPVTELCAPCHRRIAGRMSHMVDISPRKTKVPPDMPLSYGRMTCLTCHKMHVPDNNFSLRRQASGSEFCAICHQSGFRNVSHAKFLSSAHAGARYRKTGRSDIFDPVSKDCIGCHDGNLGSNVRFEPGITGFESSYHSHPVGVSYNSSRKNSGLKPFSRVNRKLRLYGGKIGCSTCHNLYSTEPKRLVISNERGGLCMSCHEE